MQENIDSQGRILSGWWRRALAFLVDSLIAATVAVAIAGPCALAVYLLLDSEVASTVVILVLAGAVVLTYSIGFPVRWNGQTPGKKLADIRIVRMDGQPVDASTMWMRYGLMQYSPNLVSSLFSPLVFVAAIYYLVDYLFPLWDDKRQCLHDKAAKTQVVYENPMPTPASTAKDLDIPDGWRPEKP